MSENPSSRWTARNTAVPQVDIDVGLRQYMLRVYNYMAGGLALTGIVAYFAVVERPLSGRSRTRRCSG